MTTIESRQQQIDDLHHEGVIKAVKLARRYRRLARSIVDRSVQASGEDVKLSNAAPTHTVFAAIPASFDVCTLAYVK